MEIIRLEDYVGLIYSCVRQLYKLSDDARIYIDNDLMQAGLLGLAKAKASYDATKGASFGTWARYHVLKCLQNELRFRRDSNKLIPSSQIVCCNNEKSDYEVDYLDDVLHDSSSNDNSQVMPLEEVEICVETRLFFDDLRRVLHEFMKETLNELEYRVIILRYFEDKTVQETAEQLKITSERVYKVCNRALKKLRDKKAILEQELAYLTGENLEGVVFLKAKKYRRRTPKFWSRHKISLKDACFLVEDVYQTLVSEQLYDSGFSKVKYVRFLSCKDKKKKKTYKSIVLSCLEMLSELFPNLIFTEHTLEQVLQDYVTTLIDYYKTYVTFNCLSADKALEYFIRYISQQYGSLERYTQLIERKNSLEAISQLVLHQKKNNNSDEEELELLDDDNDNDNDEGGGLIQTI